MFVRDSEKPFLTVLPGIQRKTLAVGEHSLVTRFSMESGSKLPEHKHPHEQVGVLLSGRLILNVGGEVCELKAGDSWAIPSDVEHSAAILEQAEAIEVFFPVRQEYL